MSSTAVVLFNLGGPDGQAAVKPFLFNLFHDPAIIRLPQPLRWFVAKMISGKREKTAQDIYAKLGGGSPIVPNTQKQAAALEKALGEGYKVFVVMRYWHPFSHEVVQDIENYKPDNLIFLPLYPQFSTTTTASSLKDFAVAMKSRFEHPPTVKTICCYPEDRGFVEAMAVRLRATYDKAKKFGEPRVLFSAHGLPEKIVKAGDPYPDHCEKSAEALRQAVGIEGLDSVLCYQSRVGPLKWIGPSTDDEIRRAAADKKPIVVVPIAFVSEHSETLVEIDMEYRHLAMEKGAPYFGYTGAVADDVVFIEGLVRMVKDIEGSKPDCRSGSGHRVCGAAIKACPMGGGV